MITLGRLLENHADFFAGFAKFIQGPFSPGFIPAYLIGKMAPVVWDSVHSGGGIFPKKGDGHCKGLYGTAKGIKYKVKKDKRR